MAVDWSRLDAMRADYIGGASYTDLSRAYGISRSAIGRKAQEEHWPDLRLDAQRRANAKIARAVASQRAEAALSALSAADVSIVSSIFNSCIGFAFRLI